MLRRFYSRISLTAFTFPYGVGIGYREELSEALAAGKSETLTAYLAAIGRVHNYSLHNVSRLSCRNLRPAHEAHVHAAVATPRLFLRPLALPELDRSHGSACGKSVDRASYFFLDDSIAACRIGFAHSGICRRLYLRTIRPRCHCSRSFGSGHRCISASLSAVLSNNLSSVNLGRSRRRFKRKV